MIVLPEGVPHLHNVPKVLLIWSQLQVLSHRGLVTEQSKKRWYVALSVRWHNEQVLQASYANLSLVHTLLLASYQSTNWCFGMKNDFHTTSAHVFSVLRGLKKVYAAEVPRRSTRLNQLSSSATACWTDPVPSRIAYQICISCLMRGLLDALLYHSHMSVHWRYW